MANQWKDLMSAATDNIDNFSLDVNKYQRVYENPITKEKYADNFVYAKEDVDFTKINIHYKPNVVGCRLFIGNNFKGQNTAVTFEQNNGVCYIGDKCNLINTKAYIHTRGGAILIGNNVATTGKNIWCSGAFPGSGYASIIVGDSCLFSWDITLRGSDAHPILDIDSWEQINQPNNFLIIEPYVWVGQGVSILKGVTVGACSVVGLGSVVSKSVPRFSVATGNPSVVIKKASNIWVKNRSKKATDTAKKYLSLYS